MPDIITLTFPEFTIQFPTQALFFTIIILLIVGWNIWSFYKFIKNKFKTKE